MSSPILGIPVMAESQAQKYLTHNNAVSLLEQSTNDNVSVTQADDDTTVTATQFNENMIVKMTWTLTANRNTIVPTQKRLFIVKNATTDGSSPATGPFDLTVKTSGGSGVVVPNGNTALLWCDGTDVLAVSGASGGSSSIPIYNEIPSGTINGSNDTFTLLHSPNPTSSLRLYLRGIRQRPTTDYSISGNTITYTSGAKPDTGDNHYADYLY
jgi:hypothetical protein